jgi:hypothetical protein
MKCPHKVCSQMLLLMVLSCGDGSMSDAGEPAMSGVQPRGPLAHRKDRPGLVARLAKNR